MPTSAPSYEISTGASAWVPTPWWLWPNILSLDAPVIASLWQNLAGKDAGVNLSVASRIALPLAVWAIYLADRLIDSTRFYQASQTARHIFYRKHRVAGLALLILVSTALTWILRFLPAVVLRNGLVVSALVALYMLAVHTLPFRLRQYLPKELASSSDLLGWNNAECLEPLANPSFLLFPALLFALLCWLNCSAIEAWELSRGHALLSAAKTLFPVAILTPASLAICLLSIGAFPFASCRLLLIAIALCALGYCWLDRIQRSLGLDAVRVLADLPLLAPLLLLLLLGWR